MGSTARSPDSVFAYARTLTGRLMTVSGGLLQAAYLHGSAALGGWVPGRSDVDMLFVIGDGIDGVAVERMSQALCEAAGQCPGRELECSVVTVAQAGQPAPPWPFVLHVAAGPGQPGRVVRPGGQSPGDPDLLMHCRVPCRWLAGVRPAGSRTHRPRAAPGDPCLPGWGALLGSRACAGGIRGAQCLPGADLPDQPADRVEDRRR
jgi:hypothetical protein